TRSTRDWSSDVCSSDLVEIRTYRIIYEAVEEVKAAMGGLLAPEKKEVVLGEAEVRQLFKIAKIGTIAGSFVRSGVIPRTARVREIGRASCRERVSRYGD